MKTTNMKKAGMVLAAMLICATVIADTETINGIEWTYTIVDGKASLGCGKPRAVDIATNGALIIPPMLGGKPTTAIGDRAFECCKGLTSVTIPDSVTFLGARAFSGCTALKNVTVGRKIGLIRDSTFENCSSLEDVTIPDSVKIVGEKAFSGCTALKSVTIGCEVSKIGKSAFKGCSSLESVVFKGRTTTVEEGAFPDGSYKFILPQGNTTYEVVDNKWLGKEVERRRFETSLEKRRPKAVPQPKIKVGTGQYMVIDLSGGVKAEKFRVSYLNSVPNGGWTDEYKTTKIVLRRIKSGTFTMGSPKDELGERHEWELQHNVTITKPFYIGVFEVTQKQYELVTGEEYLRSFDKKGDMRPRSDVGWIDIRGDREDIQASNWPVEQGVSPCSFMGILRAKTGIYTFDLPTEAMWEYACRAGTTTALNSGKNLFNKSLAVEKFDKNVAEVGRYNYNNRGHRTGWYSDMKGGIQDDHTIVGLYKPNAWGLYDMHGNVAEWCLDEWEVLKPTAVRDPLGPVINGVVRVVRGGHAESSARDVRSASRESQNIYSCLPGQGFRLCCFTAPPATVSENKSQKNAKSETKQGAGKGKPKGR